MEKCIYNLNLVGFNKIQKKDWVPIDLFSRSVELLLNIAKSNQILIAITLF